MHAFEVHRAVDADPCGEAPEGEGWTHEVKFDGYRSQMIIDEDGTRIYTRNGHDWTAKYRDLVGEAKSLGAESAIVDGEIIVLNEAGLSDFGDLRKAITRRQQDLYFVVFDLLHLNGHDLRDMALEERREILASMIKPGRRIQFSEPLPGEAKAILHLLDQAGLEGMVSKRKDSKYRSGPSANWLKAKCYAIDEFDLLGVEREADKPAFALMAERGTGRYVGSAFVTLNREMRESYGNARAPRHGAQGRHEAACDAMGQAGADRPRKAPARRG